MLTIGMPVYDDFDGVFFTIQSIRLNCPDMNIQFVVIDNNPTSADGKATKKFIETEVMGKYVEYTERIGTSIKNEIFKHSETKFTLCIDCHILLPQESIEALIEFYMENPLTEDLIQGPLVSNSLTHRYTHFNENWGSLMHGQWDFDEVQYKRGKPFEIKSMGMGLFSCRTEVWPEFHSLMKGFGGEEGYIHKKFMKRGSKCLCIPQLQWVHRFDRPRGIPYPNIAEDRLWNYFIGAFDIYGNFTHSYISEIKMNFANILPELTINHIYNTAVNEYITFSNK